MKVKTSYVTIARDSTPFKLPYFNEELTYDVNQPYDSNSLYQSVAAKRPAAFSEETKPQTLHLETNTPENTEFAIISKTSTGFVKGNKSGTGYN